MPPAPGPLSGVIVLDLTEYIFGPYATMTLADLGAEVIKIENPDGDRQRHVGKFSKSSDMSSTYMALNRNKRSVVLDLKTEAGQNAFKKLVASAQVLIHTVRADAMARLGLRYEDVVKLNPSIVYVHCVGYGSEGPYAGRQGLDDLVQAAAGAADLLPRVDGDPELRLLPSYLADKVSGLHAAYAIMAALYHRAQTGEGQFVEVPMFESFVHFMMAEHLFGETFVPPVSHPGHSTLLSPERRPYRSKDGHIAAQPLGKKAAAKFMELGGIPNAYESERFVNAPNAKAKVATYHAMMREAAEAHTTEEWMALGEEHRIPIMRANTLEELLVDPHLAAVEFFELREHPTEGTWRAMKPPVKFAKTPASIRRDPPRTGADTDDLD